jgi:hypothetical protein
MRKNKGDEPFWAIIHLYLEISQGNSLYHFFSFIPKIGEQEGRRGPAWGMEAVFVRVGGGGKL